MRPDYFESVVAFARKNCESEETRVVKDIWCFELAGVKTLLTENNKNKVEVIFNAKGEAILTIDSRSYHLQDGRVIRYGEDDDSLYLLDSLKLRDMAYSVVENQKEFYQQEINRCLSLSSAEVDENKDLKLLRELVKYLKIRKELFDETKLPFKIGSTFSDHGATYGMNFNSRNQIAFRKYEGTAIIYYGAFLDANKMIECFVGCMNQFYEMLDTGYLPSSGFGFQTHKRSSISRRDFNTIMDFVKGRCEDKVFIADNILVYPSTEVIMSPSHSYKLEDGIVKVKDLATRVYSTESYEIALHDWAEKIRKINRAISRDKLGISIDRTISLDEALTERIDSTAAAGGRPGSCPESPSSRPTSTSHEME